MNENIKINKAIDNFDTSIFWNARQTLTHSDCLFFLIIGNRGGGKSFGAKEWAIDNFLKKGEQFGYIRRYKEDLKQPMIQFFKDIEYKYPDYEFKTDANYFYIRLKPANGKQSWTEKDIAGYGFTLSTANNKKSIAYPNVTTLIFDEFLLERGNQHYLSEEPMKLLNLYETVARPGTNHPRVRLIMLANAITFTNPYTLFWDLKFPSKQDKNGKWIWKHKTRPILVEDVRNEKFIDKKKDTEFGKLVAGTKYSEYSIENKFLLDDDTFIERKGANARYYCTLVYMGKKLGVWADYTLGLMYVSNDIDPSHPIVYSTTMKDHSPNMMFFKNRAKAGRFKIFLECYKMGSVRFENMNVKNLCYDIIRLTMC